MKKRVFSVIMVMLMIFTVLPFLGPQKVLAAGTKITRIDLFYDSSLIDLSPGWTEGEVSQRAEAEGMAVNPDSGYYLKNDGNNGLVYYVEAPLSCWNGIGDGDKQISLEKQYGLKFNFYPTEGYEWPDEILTDPKFLEYQPTASEKDCPFLEVYANGDKRETFNVMYNDAWGFLSVFIPIGIPIQDKVTVTGISDKTFTGKAIKQTPVVKYEDITLEEGTDYTVSYENNTTAGTARVMINGINRFEGTIIESFEIKPAKVSIPSGKTLTYNGKAQTGVAAGSEYAISGNSATKAGSYKAKLSLKDENHIWADGSAEEKQVSWKILPASIDDVKVTGIGTKTYTGKAITQNPTVKLGGVTLKNGTDYTVAYKDNKKVGTATMTITGKGNISGTVSKTFTIDKAANPITVKAKKPVVKYKKLKKKDQKIAAKKAFTVSKAKGSLSYKKVSGNKKIKVDPKTGKITLKKGLKKDTYKVKIKVTAKGNGSYKKGSKKVTVKIKVK